jgi:phosphoglycerol geranylgeranyltransferase
MGPVEAIIKGEISRFGTICAALIDSEGIGSAKAADVARKSSDCGVSLVLVGGSTAIDQLELHSIVGAIKTCVTIPVVLFPGNVTGVTSNADAILFSSLLNSDNPYFITEAQALGAFSIKKYGLEALPMGYIVIGEGGTTGFIGRARGIPPTKPALASMYALAAKFMGMRFVYLEAGSGVTSHASSEIVASVRKVFDGILIVGGGIMKPDQAMAVKEAGADILVVGTLLEKEGFEPTLKEIVSIVRSRRLM